MRGRSLVRQSNGGKRRNKHSPKSGNETSTEGQNGEEKMGLSKKAKIGVGIAVSIVILATIIGIVVALTLPAPGTRAHTHPNS